MVGKEVEAIREVEARALHKRIFAPTFDFLDEDGYNFGIGSYHENFWDYLNYNYNTPLDELGDIIEDDDEYESAMEEMEKGRQSQIVQGICQVRKWERNVRTPGYYFLMGNLVPYRS